MGNRKPVWAVIPAAGRGQRMGNDLPKQYLRFDNRTIIEHCLERLLSHPDIDGAVLVLAEDDRYWDTLGYQPPKPLFTTVGGTERQHSVYSGLTTLQYRCGNDVLALVHDAARPLVTHADLGKVIRAAREHEAGALLASPVADTLKRQDDAGEVDATVSRERLWRALTPQVFHLSPLLNALKQAIDDGVTVTDEAQALERIGYRPALVAGRVDNLKITEPGDLRLAAMIWLDQRDQDDHE
jgi:2-C-methyl-D-erythritol 4-phosphate cytidylyltransferase